MQAKALIPVCTTVAVVAAMVWQGMESEPIVCEAPAVRLGEMDGFESEAIPPSEAELHVLPDDTIIDKRMYRSQDGSWYSVSLIIGGRSKGSIHRPEMCLPSQGFQMTQPRTCEVSGVDWRLLTLARRDAPNLAFAYTFFNQDGFRTDSHVARIFRDVWDRSVRGRIDRWAMVTVNGYPADSRLTTSFLSRLWKEALR